MARRPKVAPGILILAALWAAPAVSQNEPRQQRAEKLAQAGELLFDTGKYQDALRQFLDAYDLFEPPAFVIPEVLWNIARCYEETGDDLSALRYFEEFRTVTNTPEYREAVDGRLRQVRDRLAGEVEITVSPPTAQAWLDGEPLALEQGKAHRRLAPGLHSVKAQAPGFHGQERSFRVEPRETGTQVLELQAITGVLAVTASRDDWAGTIRVRVDGQEVFQGEVPARIEVPSGWRTVRLEAEGLPEAQMEALEVPEQGTASITLRVPVAPPPPAVEPGVVTGTPEPVVRLDRNPRPEDRRKGAWAAIGTGLGLAVLGAGGLGLGAWDRNRITSAATAPDGTVIGIGEAEAHRLASRARAWDIAGGVLLGAGGAAILTGVVLYLTRPRATETSHRTAPVIGGTAGPGSLQVVAHLRW